MDLVVDNVEPVHVLTLCDKEYSKIVMVAIGGKSSCVRKMCELSEVLHVAGDTVETDMSRTLSGYPTINHQKVSLQVITLADWLEGERSVKDFVATGGHLT